MPILTKILFSWIIEKSDIEPPYCNYKVAIYIWRHITYFNSHHTIYLLHILVIRITPIIRHISLPASEIFSLKQVGGHHFCFYGFLLFQTYRIWYIYGRWSQVPKQRSLHLKPRFILISLSPPQIACSWFLNVLLTI